MHRERFSPERLRLIRRLRRARRLYRKMPLFAFDLMRAEDPSYTYEEFVDDLRLRNKPKVRKAKDQAVSFGRYYRIRKLLAGYHASGDTELLLAASKLWQRLRKPYVVVAKLKDERFEFHFPPKVPIERIETFTLDLRHCKTIAQVQECYRRFSSTINLY